MSLFNPASHGKSTNYIQPDVNMTSLVFYPADSLINGIVIKRIHFNYGGIFVFLKLFGELPDSAHNIGSLI